MSLRQCKIIDESVISAGFLSTFDYVLTDCDGVLWIGEEAIPGSPEAVKKLVDLGKHVIYVTNNSTKNRKEYLKKCQRLGFPADLEDIFPTSYCAAVYLQSLKFNQKIYVFGSIGLVSELNDAGIETLPIGPDPLLVSWSKYVSELKLDPEVGAVVVGFDEHLSYPKVMKAASYLKDPKCLFIATNRDEQFPFDANITIPGTGTFVKAIETCAGRESISLGKPSRFMFDCIKQIHPNIEASRCLMIGDKLNTDILLGTGNDMQTLLVLTGISGLDEVRSHENSSNPEDHLLIPDFYLSCLGDLVKFLE